MCLWQSPRSPVLDIPESGSLSWVWRDPSSRGRAEVQAADLAVTPAQAGGGRPTRLRVRRFAITTARDVRVAPLVVVRGHDGAAPSCAALLRRHTRWNARDTGRAT